MIHLALDPSYCNTGWAVMDGMKLEDYGVIATKKDDSAKSVMRDNLRRDFDIVTQLSVLLRFIDGQVYAEMPSCGGKSAGAITAMARISGLVSATCFLERKMLVPITAHVAQQKTIGKCLTKDKKTYTMAYVIERYPALAKEPKRRAEHVCDAIAAYLAADSMGLVRKE
jgi:hypothetical protein